MHLLHHQFHLHVPHYADALKKDINGLYFVHAIRGFVFSLFGILIPIYLLSLGFPLVLVLCFFIIYRIALLITSFLTGPVGNRLGLKHTMLISLPLALAYLVCLSLLKNFPSTWLFFLLAAIGGIQASLYWIPLHSLFSRYTETGHRSMQVGKLLSLQHVATMVAPLLGGTITFLFGFESLFVVAFLLLLVPIGILFYSPDIKPHIAFKFKKGLPLLKKHKRYFFQLSTDLTGQISESVLWPIFAYSVLASELAIGLVGTLVGLGTVIFTILIGRRANRNNRMVMIKIAAVLLAAVWLVKFFADTTLVIYFLSVLAGFFTIMFAIPHMADTYALAKKEKALDEFIIFRELPVAMGSIFILLVGIVFADQIEVSFLVTGLNYLALLFL